MHGAGPVRVQRRDAGVDHFRLHDLRHFMATQMLAAGVPIATVSRRLGHARCSTTLNVDAHAIPGDDEAAAETLASVLAGAGSELRPDGTRRHLAPADQVP
jgi:integrase